MSALRVLVVAPEPVFTPRGTPFSVCHRLAIATELGLDVDLLTYDEGEDPDLPGLTIYRIPRLPFLPPVRIGPSFGKLLRDALMVVWTVALLIRRRPHVVHAHEEAIFWCRLLKPLFGFRLIYDMHSLLSQQLINFEFTNSRLLVGLFKRLENSALRASDAVLTVCPSLASVATDRMSDPDRHTLLENSILDPVRLNRRSVSTVPGDAGGGDLDREPWPEAWSDDDIVLYAGNLEPYQGIELLLKAFQIVRGRRPTSRLVIVGGRAEQLSSFRVLASSLGIEPYVWFTGSVSQRVARHWMSSAAVMVSPRIRGRNTPLKVYELLASGKPFVATRIESHTQVLDESVCVLADPEPVAFAEGVLASLAGGASIQHKVRRAGEVYQQDYSREAYRAKFAGVLGKLASAGSAVEVPLP